MAKKKEWKMMKSQNPLSLAATNGVSVDLPSFS